MREQQLRISMAPDQARRLKAMAQLLDIPMGELITSLIRMADELDDSADQWQRRIQKTARATNV